MRLGLERVIACEQDLQVVGVTSSKAELWPLLCRTRPQVVVLDLAHPSRMETDSTTSRPCGPSPPTVMT
jgi:DNA-binding NarL/FixJ family response regulator